MKRILLILIIIFSVSTVWAEPQLDQKLINLCNQVMLNIYYDILNAKDRYPELKKVPPPWKHLIFWLLGRTPALFLAKFVSQNLYYYALSKKYFLEGLKQKNGSNNF